MDVTERREGDRQVLGELIGKEGNVKQRDRLRAVELALEGHDKAFICDELERCKSFVEDWVYAYRDGGIGAVIPKKPSGRPSKLPKEREQEFLARVDAGPMPEDHVCTLRGVELQRILREHFGANYSERGVYALMKRLGYASLKPRPIHEKHDPAKAEQFKQSAPFLSMKRRLDARTRSSA